MKNTIDVDQSMKKHTLRTNGNEGHNEVKARKKKMEGITESENKKYVINFFILIFK